MDIRICDGNEAVGGLTGMPHRTRLTVRPIDAAEHLAFVRAQRSVSFQQTPAWGEVKTAWRSESLGWYAGQRLVGAGLVLHRPVPRLERLTLAYLPWGPAIDWGGDLEAWLGPMVAHLREGGAFAVRIAPPQRTHTWGAATVKAGLAEPTATRLTALVPTDVDRVGADLGRRLGACGWLSRSAQDGFGAGQPQFTYELPLRHPDGRAKSRDELLAGMNQLWRRNIRRAASVGVEVTTSSAEADLAAFHALYVHTAERDGFRPRPLPYFEGLVTALAAEDPGRVRLHLVRHDGDLVAAAIRVRVGGHAWYVYGASATTKREVRGANACQWAMICDALDEGCDVYDLRGITPTLDAGDPHVGLIRFKVGTGGRAVRYVGEWDLPLRPVVYRVFDRYLNLRART
jgi:lipid II:glycine glycyltransferase (peptidoglycan interpeptide bridge formation enzyme)